jgi:hypothetical protein
MYSSTLSLTSELDGVDGQGHAPAALSPRKKPGTHCGSQGRSGRVRKISPLPGFDPRTVQPVASHYMPYLHELVVGEHRRTPLDLKKMNKVRNIPNTSTKFIQNNHNKIYFSNLFLRIRLVWKSVFCLSSPRL